MPLTVQQRTRVRIARYGPNRLYGDYKERQDLASRPEGERELEARFDRVWNGGLAAEVQAAKACTPDWAWERLTNIQRGYFDRTQAHRQFRYANMEFIAQIKEAGTGNGELTDLWKIPSGDDHPRVLWITFDTVEEKRDFVRLAENLGYDAEELGLELLRDFARKFERRPPAGPGG